MEPQEKDIEYLVANPDKAAQFDKHFGAGKSASILNPIPDAATIPATASSPVIPEGSVDDVVIAGPAATQADLDRAEQVQNGTAPEQKDLVPAGPRVLEGALHGGQEAFNQVASALESFDDGAGELLQKWGLPSRVQITDGEGNLNIDLMTQDEAIEAGASDGLGGKVGTSDDIVEVEEIKEPVGSLGRFTSSTTQFVAGFLVAKKVTGLTGLMGAAANGALADGIVFDPDDPNLSSFMAENEYAVPMITEALATDPDDPEWQNRMRNMTEGVVLGAALDFTLKGMRGLAKTVKGQKMGGPEGEALVKEGQEMAEEASQDAAMALDEGVSLEASPKQEPFVLTGEQRVDEPVSTVAEVPTQGTTTPPAPRESLVNSAAIKDALADRPDADTVTAIAESNWFNAARMEGPMEAQAMIDVASEALENSGGLGKLGLDGPQSYETVIKDAKDELASLTGGSLDQLTARVALVGDAAVDQAKFLVAGKMALQSTGRELSSIARRLDTMYALGKVDPEVEVRLVDLMTTHANLQGHVKRVQTASARAVSAGNIVTGDGLDAAAVDALTRVKEAGGSKAIADAVKRLKLAGGPTQQAALIRQLKRGSKANRAMKVVNEVFINSILSGWGTHAVNMTSNMINTMVLPLERSIGGALTGSGAEFKKGLSQYVQIRSTVMDSVRLSARVLWNEMPVLDTQVKLDYQQEGMKAISAEALGVESRAGGAIVNGIGKALRMPGRFLMAEDEFFKQIMFRSRLQSSLSVDAAALTPAQLKKMGYKSKGEFIHAEVEAATQSVQTLNDQFDMLVLKGRVADDPKTREAFLKDNLGAAAEGSSTYGKDALRVAREATFTSPLEKGTISRSWQDMANRHPFLRQVTPFIQTPVNILNKAFDRTPGVNLLRTRYRDRLRSADASVRAEAAGEMATGVALSTSLYMLALEGRISGGGPVDSKKRAVWQADSNWQPYSLNVGSESRPEWIELKRLDPFAFTFGIAGDMAEMIQAAENDPSLDQAGMFAMLAASVGNNLTSKTWLQGVSEVVEVLNSKDRPHVVQRWLENKVSAFVPFSSAQRGYNQTQDGIAKEARGYIDKIKANTAGYSADLPDRYNWVDGETIENPSKLLGYIKSKTGTGDRVTRELRELNYGFTGPDRKIGAITLNGSQFQEWNRLMGTVRIHGKTLKQRLEMAMKTDAYDMDRERVPDGLTAPAESHRVDMLRGVITSYKQKSRAVLFEANPELFEAWQEYEKFEGKAKAGQVPEGARENLLLKF